MRVVCGKKRFKRVVLLIVSTVSKEWHQAAHHNNLWKLLTLRISPAAPFIAEFNEEEDEDGKKNALYVTLSFVFICIQVLLLGK